MYILGVLWTENYPELSQVSQVIESSLHEQIEDSVGPHHNRTAKISFKVKTALNPLS